MFTKQREFVSKEMSKAILGYTSKRNILYYKEQTNMPIDGLDTWIAALMSCVVTEKTRGVTV